MKKLLISLMLLSSLGLAYADADPAGDPSCAKTAQKVADKASSHNVSSVKLTYSSDNAAWADKCSALLSKKGITLEEKQVSGSGTAKFSRAN